MGKPANEVGLCSGKERKRFNQSANSAQAVGNDARHRLGKVKPPPKPMNFQEAKKFINQLLLETLKFAGKKRL